MRSRVAEQERSGRGGHYEKGRRGVRMLVVGRGDPQPPPPPPDPAAPSTAALI